jgi:hypothetical protein
LEKHVEIWHSNLLLGLGQGLVQHKRERLERLSNIQVEEVHGIGEICHASKNRF